MYVKKTRSLKLETPKTDICEALLLYSKVTVTRDDAYLSLSELCEELITYVHEHIHTKLWCVAKISRFL